MKSCFFYFFQKIAVCALLFAAVALAKPLAESDPHADPYYYSGMPVDVSGDFSFRQQLTNL